MPNPDNGEIISDLELLKPRIKISPPSLNEAPAEKAVFVIGPTASGKTDLALALAREFDGEIISVDSRQVYRGMDIGTGKELAKFGEGASSVPSHLIDVAAPSEEFNLFRYLEMFRDAVRRTIQHGKLPVAVGGSPLYLKAVLENYSLPGAPADAQFRAELDKYSTEELIQHLKQKAPDLFAGTDLSQRKRIIRGLEIAYTRNLAEVDIDEDSNRNEIPIEPLLIAPFFSRSEIHRRIEQRLDVRLSQGMVEEVEKLHENGISWEKLASFGLEYRESVTLLRGETSFQDFRDQLATKIRRFCKSQDCWFRKFEREGWDIYWIPKGNRQAATELVSRFLNYQPLPQPEIRLENIRYGPKSQ